MIRSFLTLLLLPVLLLSCGSGSKEEAVAAAPVVVEAPAKGKKAKSKKAKGKKAKDLNPVVAESPVKPVVAESPVTVVAPDQPAVIQLPRTEVVRQTLNGVDLVLVRFDDRAYEMRVVDQRGGPGSRWATASLAGRGMGALAAINGGFFTPEGDPLGLVVARNKRAGFWNKVSSLCSGVFVVDAEGPKLVRSRSWLPQREASELLQTGPFLVEGGVLVEGLESEEDRARSFLLWDGRNGWAMGYTRSATLEALGKALASDRFKGLAVSSALNLDGGRSADLWVSNAVKGGGVTERLWWNRPVRNFLVLKKKGAVGRSVPVKVLAEESLPRAEG